MFKRIGAMMLVLVLGFQVLALTGCNKKDEQTADDTLKEFADMFCGDIIDGDYARLEDDSKLDKKMKSSEFDKSLDIFYDNQAWDKDTEKICDYIQSTLKYKIDDNSVFGSYSTGKGEFEVEFTFVDFEELYDTTNAGNVEEYLEQLKSYDKTYSRNIHINCVFEDGLWYVDDYERVFIDIFEWKDFHFDFIKNYNDYITSTYWVHSDAEETGNVYNNVNEIQLTIEVSASDIDWTHDVYYKIFRDDEQIFTSDLRESSRFYDYYWAGYSTYWFDVSEPLPSGEYRIELYDFRDNLLFTETCTVTRK